MFNMGSSAMVDDITEPAGQAPDNGRSRRPPPTIDLEPTSSETHPAPAEAVAEASSDVAGESHPHVAPEPELSADEIAAASAAANDVPPHVEPGPPPARPISPWVIAPFSGAVAAALVIGVGWMLGWPQVLPPSAAPQLATVVDGVTARVNGLEAKLGKADSTAAARLDTLDKALASVRSDLAQLRAQSDKAAAAINELKTAPRDTGGQANLEANLQANLQAGLAALTARLDQIERANRSQDAALAQQDQKLAEAKPADDLPLRRVIAAALLDVAVRHGDPFATVLDTAKSLAPKADALKPLDTFASTGVPNPIALDRELLTIVPKLSPQPQEGTTSGSSIVDRLQAGAAKLVRIERTDAVGTDRGAIVARVTAAALRNEFAEARRELKTLAPADRAPAQAWLDKADARDAALAASRHFADEAMAALANVSQN
jgi:hypothetical protein